ncbi:hypothetical protein [Methanoculleus frigidifontis]|nr:hypothetical protein [Methanoculleus sp. FWC-SCC1]
MNAQQIRISRTHALEHGAAEKKPAVTFEDLLVEIRARQRTSRMSW